MGSSLLPQRVSALDVECPAGYRFYACSVSSFQGCCSIDPCGLQDACPGENRPGSPTSSNTPVITAEPTPPPFSTNIASFTNLSTSRTITIVIPTTHLPLPTTTTATVSTIFSLPPSSSPSASSSASTSSSKQLTPVGLIVGLTVGFTVLALMLALVIHLLWRRRETRGKCDEEPTLPMRSLRTTAFYLPQKLPFNSPTTITSPNTDKPVPPPPTSSRPWRESFAEAGLADQAKRNRPSPSPKHIPIKVASAATDTSEAAPAPTVWRHRGDAPREPAQPAAGAGAQGSSTQPPMSRSASPVDSIFDVPQRRTTAELDASWASFREEGPAAFHGLSAPPRSRDGSRPGSNGTQGA